MLVEGSLTFLPWKVSPSRLNQKALGPMERGRSGERNSIIWIYTLPETNIARENDWLED